MKANDPVKSEISRLRKLFSDIPKDKLKLIEGLIVQAARLRVRLNDLWADIQENGETEMFSQSEKTDPYERERPAARLFISTDKNYQSVMKQLLDMLPECVSADASSELAKFLSKGR
jgi:hypothetical protein